MAKRRSHLDGLLGPLETEVMETVWRFGNTTVRDVHEELAHARDIAYTTVMTTMARLAGKGLLDRDTSGLAHRYRPAVTREQYAASTVTSVVDWLMDRFPEPALSRFVEVVDARSDGSAGTADGSSGAVPAPLDVLRRQVEEAREREG